MCNFTRKQHNNNVGTNVVTHRTPRVNQAKLLIPVQLALEEAVRSGYGEICETLCTCHVRCVPGKRYVSRCIILCTHI